MNEPRLHPLRSAEAPGISGISRHRIWHHLMSWMKKHPQWLWNGVVLKFIFPSHNLYMDPWDWNIYPTWMGGSLWTFMLVNIPSSHGSAMGNISYYSWWFQPNWTIWVKIQNGNLPHREVKIKIIENHHLDPSWPVSIRFTFWGDITKLIDAKHNYVIEECA